MRGLLRRIVQRRTHPPLALGIVVAILCVMAETLAALLLKQTTPVRFLGIVYLLGVSAVVSVWSLWLGIATAAISTLAFDYFLIPPLGSLYPAKPVDWVVLAIFLVVALLVGLISGLARSLALEIDARGEADLSADLARILLHEPDLKTAQSATAQHLARALDLPSAAIERDGVPEDEHRVAFALHEHGVPVASLLVPADLPRQTLRRLRDRVVPSMEVLLQEARERERAVEEQVALRRLGTLVVHGASPEEIFGAVAREVGQILKARYAAVVRYEPDATMTVVGTWNSGPVATVPLGSRWPLEKWMISELVARTKTPGRIDAIQATIGASEVLRDPGVDSSVGCPITVGGRLWGVVAAGSTSEPMPEDTEKRMLDFTDLLGTAIGNADSHAKLEASRARVLAAADATRRLIERDLHDGTQQRLVSLMLELRAMEATVPADPEELRRLLSHTAQGLDEALRDLQEIARGLHPALLSRRGLEPAIKALARCSAVPVELNVRADRLPERSEETAYYVVSEALTNAAEHAAASLVHVDLIVKDANIRLWIRDDGKGGADPHHGSGLLNITDRVEALGGTLEIMSPVGEGTSLFAEIPITNDR
ncbi:MAG: DUF4118 domain-containing protein [Actinoallomurus sp.]